MKRFFILLLLFSACKKDENFDFPLGKWEAYALKLVEPFDSNYQTTECNLYSIDDFSPSEIKGISLEYYGGNKIHYGSFKGTESFKIKKVNKKEEAGKTIYTLKLRNKKGKLFIFEYESELKYFYDYSNNIWTEKTVLIGDYWIKGSHYSSYYSPNRCNGCTCSFYNQSGDLATTYSSYDLLGIFKFKE